jgi:hypothetical protein
MLQRTWQTSLFCGQNQCVEVAYTGGVVQVRDSKDRDRGIYNRIVTLSPLEYQRLVNAIDGLNEAEDVAGTDWVRQLNRWFTPVASGLFTFRHPTDSDSPALEYTREEVTAFRRGLKSGGARNLRLPPKMEARMRRLLASDTHHPQPAPMAVA